MHFGLAELLDIISQIDYILPQLSKFIEEFNTVVSDNDINVIKDVHGDVPSEMSNEISKNLSKRIGILDRLINTKSSDIHTLFQQAQAEQTRLEALNTKDIPQISKQMQTILDLNVSFKR
ncbi:uncharacterized protein RAG0_17778 [Rhynchosporium agropyri]|uniref:Uncharacterized protein n=1 Tax=Rhynchosporium agropyri TaxID=914238 RepID=A0A1E1LU19_9HELO|nr:uncharacterized protein RAG0_17778 [Rhynchosporium agropyri]